MILGVTLTIYKNNMPVEVFSVIENMLITYWPLVISFIGIYMISLPKKRRR